MLQIRPVCLDGSRGRREHLTSGRILAIAQYYRKEGMTVPRGRYWSGPGFWKRSTDWVPGSGGFRGGAYPYGGPGAFPPRWWGPCYRLDVGYPPDPPWMAGPEPKDEARFLKEQAKAIRIELEEIEQRLVELEQEQKTE